MNRAGIAIIEDQTKLATSLAEGFQSEGSETSIFHDGETFLERIEQGADTYDLIILDVGLPGMGGNEVSAQLRARNILTPILVLTAHDSIEDKVLALDSGADDFLAKPFSFDELMARTRALLRRAAVKHPATIAFNDLSVDIRTRTVQRAGEAIVLTPTEFDLLALLLENRDTPLSREDISSALWEVRDLSLSNIVDVHISNLRKKIDGAYDTKLISTVRGLGYQLAQ